MTIDGIDSPYSADGQCLQDIMLRILILEGCSRTQILEQIQHISSIWELKRTINHFGLRIRICPCFFFFLFPGNWNQIIRNFGDIVSSRRAFYRLVERLHTVYIVYQFTSFTLYGIPGKWYHYVVEKKNEHGVIEYYDGLRSTLDKADIPLRSIPDWKLLRNMVGNRVAIWR